MSFSLSVCVVGTLRARGFMCVYAKMLVRSHIARTKRSQPNSRNAPSDIASAFGIYRLKWKFIYSQTVSYSLSSRAKEIISFPLRTKDRGPAAVWLR